MSGVATARAGVSCGCAIVRAIVGRAIVGSREATGHVEWATGDDSREEAMNAARRLRVLATILFGVMLLLALVTATPFAH